MSSDMPEDPFKDIMEFIQKIFLGNGAPDKNAAPIIGVKVMMTGGKPHIISSASRPKTIPIESFDMGNCIILQTALPPESPDDFSLSYEEGVLHLVSGEEHEYKAAISLPNLDMNTLKTSLKNGVLEIVCAKKGF